MSKTAIAVSIVLLAGCGDSTAPDDSFAAEDLVGVWHATSFNGDPVPGVVTTTDDIQFIFVSIVIELDSGSTGVLRVDDGARPSENDLTWSVTSAERGEFNLTIDDFTAAGFKMAGRYDEGVLRVTDQGRNKLVFEPGNA